MSETLSKATLLENLRSDHADMEAILGGLTEEQMNRPGVIGSWSIKDLIAHLTYWERRAAFLLEAAVDGYREEADIWKTGSVDDQNGRNFHNNTARPPADVLADWRSVMRTLVALIERLPEDRLASDFNPDWLAGQALSIQLENETYGHIEEHWPDVQNGLAQLSR
jgi:uncharacterized protein (TIGR03083 family)